MSKETVKQYIRNQYTGKEQCQFLPQMNQQDSLAHSSLKEYALMHDLKEDSSLPFFVWQAKQKPVLPGY